MYRRDLITAEIQKLTQVLAKVLGLKQQGKLQETQQVINDTLSADFDLISEVLNTSSTKEFETLLRKEAGHSGSTTF